jgi:GDP-L-fucose synthase
MNKDARIYVAGHRGMVGSAIVRRLRADGYEHLITATHQELDLTNQSEVDAFMAKEHPEYVFLAAARVGGILANNTYPAEFIYQNLMIEANVIHAAWRHCVKRLLFLGSSCVYPRLAPQPMPEEALLTGTLEPTNEPYAIAKIAGIKLCESYNRQYGTDFRSIMPSNLYGPGDNFDLETSHVLPTLIRKFHEAKLNGDSHVTVWGTGKPRREFLYVNDCADAAVFVIGLSQDELAGVTTPMQSHLNVGSGEDLPIRELAERVRSAVGFRGVVAYDTSKPDGTPRKLLNVDRLTRMGWMARTPLPVGLLETYDWFRRHHVSPADPA